MAHPLGVAAAGVRAWCFALGVRSEAVSVMFTFRRGGPAEGVRRPTLSQTIPDVKVLGSRARPGRGGWCRPGDGRARTADPLLAKQVLSQLSYIPVLPVTAGTIPAGPSEEARTWAFLDSNQRPHGYQPCALTN
jgi:hypothetical protein